MIRYYTVEILITIPLYTCVTKVIYRVPKKGSGYASLTVSQAVYEHFKESFQQNRRILERKGISSLTGYVTSRLEELMLKDRVFARYAPFMEEFGYDEDSNTIYIKDNRTKRIAGITIVNNKLHCDVDEKEDCAHIGFAYSLPKVYEAMIRLGIPAPGRITGKYRKDNE
jgi:hypothetical protein